VSQVGLILSQADSSSRFLLTFCESFSTIHVHLSNIYMRDFAGRLCTAFFTFLNDENELESNAFS
jgi:hypothetical protein